MLGACNLFDEKGMQRTGLILMSTTYKTAMLSLQQQSMPKFCRHNEFFVLLRNVSGCSDKKVSLANYSSIFP